jgi:hypothetical protein
MKAPLRLASLRSASIRKAPLRLIKASVKIVFLTAKPIGPCLLPLHGDLGLILVAMAWPASWLQVSPLSEYSFFPLWFGYILIIDALVLRRKGTSLLVGNPRVFWGMFLASIPLWWTFEGINYFTQNWHYLGSEGYPTLRYVMVASWHFAIVIPAVFETAELVGSLSFLRRFQYCPKLPISWGTLVGAMALGLLSFAALICWPRYAFPSTWLFLILLLDPINYLWGRPSILGQLHRGDWRLVISFGAGALVCGWFWEMWNYWAFPKWQYTIPYVDFAYVFEMPLLGYGGYLPFGLEIYVAYHFLSGFVEWGLKGYPRIASLKG